MNSRQIRESLGFSRSEISLKEGFRLERKTQRIKQFVGESCSYLSDEDRKKYEITYDENGLCRTESGKLMEEGRYIFARMLNGKIYAAKETEVLHHSYLINGKKASSVGYKTFNKKGELLVVSNETGHYMSMTEEMLYDIHHFYKLSKNEKLIYEDHSRVVTDKGIYRYSAKEVLEKKGVHGANILEVINDRSSHFGKTFKNIGEGRYKDGSDIEVGVENLETDDGLTYQQSMRL